MVEILVPSKIDFDCLVSHRQPITHSTASHQNVDNDGYVDDGHPIPPPHHPPPPPLVVETHAFFLAGDTCLSNPCDNGGTCIYDANTVSHRCVCLTEYVGLTCAECEYKYHV